MSADQEWTNCIRALDAVIAERDGLETQRDALVKALKDAARAIEKLSAAVAGDPNHDIPTMAVAHLAKRRVAEALSSLTPDTETKAGEK